jgi:cell division protease FtsH
VSEATANLIDAEVRELIESGERTARRILKEHESDLHALANALLEFETLSGDEVRGLLRGEKIVRKSDDEEMRGSAGPAVPVAGKQRPREEPGSGGLEPQPT